MRTLLPSVIALLLLSSLTAQSDYAFTFDVKDPDSVTHIFINMDFSPVDEIPASVGRFVNLKELTVLYSYMSEHFTPTTPRTIKFEVPERRRPSLGLTDTITGYSILRFNPHIDSVPLPEIGINNIPEEIGACSQLEILQIPEGRITSLPSSFAQLHKLRKLSLPGSTDLDALTSTLSQLPALDSIYCFGCKLSDENRALLLETNPALDLVITEEDLYRDHGNRTMMYGFMMQCECGQMGMMFSRKIEARMYLHSTPPGMREKYQMAYNESRVKKYGQN